MDFPEEARQAGHILVDLLSVLHSDLSDEDAGVAESLAFKRINEVGAFSFERRSDGVMAIDASNLMLATVYLLNEMVEKTAEELGDPENKDVVLASLRQMLDEA